MFLGKFDKNNSEDGFFKKFSFDFFKVNLIQLNI